MICSKARLRRSPENSTGSTSPRTHSPYRTGMGHKRVLIAAVMILTAVVATAEDDVLRVANWLVGSFDNRTQYEASRTTGSADRDGVVRLVARPIQDPVVFEDAVYIYIEQRFVNEPAPYRQRVFKLKKSGRRIRLEVLRIDPQLLIPLSSEPQMLSQLAPVDLTKETGCDINLELRSGGYEGATHPRACKSDWQGSAYTTSAIRITADRVVILDRGYDAKGVQTFGPADGRGYELRRTAP